MEVHFTPEEAARLSEIAAHEGIGTEQLVKDAALHLLEDDAAFRAAVQKGLEQADRGEFIEEEEMDERINSMLEISVASEIRTTIFAARGRLGSWQRASKSAR